MHQSVDIKWGTIMYLEISGRQTGKTSRLVAAIDMHLSNPNNRACIVPHLFAHGNDILRKINRNYIKRAHVSTTIRSHVDWLRGVMDVSDNRVRFFYDEFDFHNTPDDVIPFETGYYCTTARFYRTQDHWKEYQNDPLLRLIVLNEFKHESYHGMKSIYPDFESLKDRIKFMGIEQFNHEFMTGFDSVIEEPKPKPKISFGQIPSILYK